MSRTSLLKVVSSHRLPRWGVARCAHMPPYHTSPGEACPAPAVLARHTNAFVFPVVLENNNEYLKQPSEGRLPLSG